MERTLVFAKPDAVQRGLLGEILSRFEKKGLKVVGLKFMHVNDKLLTEHYSHISDKPFFGDLKKFLQSSPILAIVLEGLEAVDAVRRVCGTTKSRSAEAGTIRGDFGMGYGANIVHASDSLEAAKEEIARFFTADELYTYKRSDFEIVYATEIDGDQRK